MILTTDSPYHDPLVVKLATTVMGWTWDKSEGTWRTSEGQYIYAGWDPLTEIEDAWRLFTQTLDPNRTSLHPCGNGQDGLWWAIYYDDKMVAHAKTVGMCICLFAVGGDTP